MARDPVDVDLEALRKQIEDLTAANATLSEVRDQLSSQVSALQQELETERLGNGRRVGALEGFCSSLRRALDDVAPAPKTDLEAAVAEFVAKIPRG